MSQNDQSGSSVEQLVQAAREGDSGAWTAIIQRYGGLIRNVARRYRLSPADTEDVSQLVWAKLFDHIGRIREPRALPGWIVKTTANTSLGIARTQARVIPTDPVTLAQRKDATRASRTAADAHEPPSVLQRKEDLTFLRKGLDELPSEQRELLILLMADPPLTYQQISKQLGRPIGSIGPTRARILDRLRKTTAVRGITLADDKDSLTALAA
jgi:RNA polymerase sigma factor (sigma-70 family)